MNLSEHFTLEEFISSDYAARKGLDNTPPLNVIENLKLVAELMEQVREILGKPIYISSGYRCSALNKAIGGKPTSKHIDGLAVDFKCPEFGNPIDVCITLARSELQFGKLILEYYSPDGHGWTHMQLGSNDRTIWTINEHGTFSGIRQ